MTFRAWLATLDPTSALIGGLVGLLVAVAAAWLAWRRGVRAEAERLGPALVEREAALAEARAGREQAERRCIELETRLEAREQAHAEKLAQLENAEKRLTESFERLASKVFEERSTRLSELNTKQIDQLLKPLGEKLGEFRSTVSETHRREMAQHEVLKEKLRDLEKLNERLHDDARNLANALTSNVKAQGNWGEQQLERLLELAGLERGREYSTQVSVTTEGGQRVQPDLVLHLPEGKAIVMDSKVSLNAWTRHQATDDDADRARMMKEHLVSIRNHVTTLGEKRYAEIPELNALDFVLMFVPIEAALIEALRADPELPAFALRHRVALLSPTNLLATLRTVASVWMVHKQNSNAQEIARRAGLLYDKFAGFADNLQQIGMRIRQAQESYDSALGQLSKGPGNLVRQVEMLSELGARNTKQIAPGLREADEEDGPARLGDAAGAPRDDGAAPLSDAESADDADDSGGASDGVEGQATPGRGVG